MSSTIFLLIFMCCACVACVSAAGTFLLIRRGGKAPSSGGSQTTTTTTLTDGALYTLSRDGVYLANDFDTRRGKGKMCNATTTTDSSGASRLKLTKDGDNWIVATDCDGDGKYTSYLSYGNDLIEAKMSDTSNQRWSIACDAAGCTFKNASKGTYLTGSLTSPTWSTTPLAWSFVPS